MPKQTVAMLQAQVDSYRGTLANMEKANADLLETRTTIERAFQQQQQDIADLKMRLQAAESSNQQMRGYIQRVQEDDVVREDLVTVGDPQGEQRVTPKRKHVEFPRPEDFAMPAHHERGHWMGEQERHSKARHWITY